jgi:hypothetical protein
MVRRKKKTLAGGKNSYFNLANANAFTGDANVIKKKFNVTDTWLTKQPVYTLHKPARRHGYPTRSYKVAGSNELWQVDLMEMIPYAKVNSGHKYILTCIDVFSRFAWTIPLKSKSGKDVHAAFEKLLDNNEKPRYIQSDLGKEFYNAQVQTLFKHHDIGHYSVHSQFKAAVVERFNRTLRERMKRYFTHTATKQWVWALPKIVHGYNNTKHRGIGMRKPIDLYNTTLDYNIWLEQQYEQKQRRKKLFSISDYVRVSHVKGPFLKNFEENWSEEVFRIVAIDNTQAPTMYIIEDLNSDVIKGKFYHEELQKVQRPDIFRIEKILQTKGQGKYKQHYVKWIGYPKQYNSWIKASSIVK